MLSNYANVSKRLLKSGVAPAPVATGTGPVYKEGPVAPTPYVGERNAGTISTIRQPVAASSSAAKLTGTEQKRSEAIKTGVNTTSPGQVNPAKRAAAQAAQRKLLRKV